MAWASAAEFWAMGGHGFYVWGSYGAAALLMVVEPFLVAHRRRRAWAEAAQAETWKDSET